jgi:hypothetical protein
MSAFHIDVVADPRPGSRGYFKWYWTKGPGLLKWVGHPHPWTTLRNHLLKYIPVYANETASQWFHDTFGFWPGERQGLNPFGPG